MALHCQKRRKFPNVIFILADQWRAQDVGFMGNEQVRTPHLDKLAGESIVLQNAISGCPVCSPYRGSLMTGQYPLTHGVFYNDKPLKPKGKTLGECFRDAGYATAYIGKWHLKGHAKGVSVNEGRQQPVPQDRRLGFDFWRVHECTHDYNYSIYFDEQNTQHTWDGYDAIAQTKMAQEYIQNYPKERPFFLFLSWGPPHAPYHTAPEEFRSLYVNPEKIDLRSNVPNKLKEQAQRDIVGYYAHITALDHCVGELVKTIQYSGIAENTIFVFTSDHGDMLYSHGQVKKQKPWDESIRVPFLLRHPKLGARHIKKPINTPDIMPTVLSLCGLQIPDSVEGQNYAALLSGNEPDGDGAAIIECPVPFHQWNYQRGGREYRGVRTSRYTYVRDLNGPWLLYDNLHDEYQLNNLVNDMQYADIQDELDDLLSQKLAARHDEFRDGAFYMLKWDYAWDGEDAQK